MSSYEKKGSVDTSEKSVSFSDLAADVEEARPPAEEAAVAEDYDDVRASASSSEAPNENALILSVLTGAPLVPTTRATTRVPTFRPAPDDDDDGNEGSPRRPSTDSLGLGGSLDDTSFEDSRHTSHSLGLSEFGLDEDYASSLDASGSRRGLTKSEKAWDIKRTGAPLDPAARALKDLDKAKSGRLSKAQQYDLMQEHLETKAELSRFRKGVYTLLGLTILLALANVGSSFAAAYLSKDTKTVDAKLVESSTGDTVKTDSTTKVFVIEKAFDEEYQRKRRLVCAEGDEDCFAETTWGVMAGGTAQDLIAACMDNGGATVRREFERGLVDHPVCPVSHPDHKSTSYHCNERQLPGLIITFKGEDEPVTILPHEDCSGDYVVAGLKSTKGEPCNEDVHCASPLACDGGLCGTQSQAATRKTYIVAFKRDGESPSKKCEALANAHGGGMGLVYTNVLHGCEMKLPEAAVAALSNNPNVRAVQEDAAGTISAAPWGQDRMDQCETPLSGAKTILSAPDVMIFVLDTGVMGNHDAFNGVIDLESDCHGDAVSVGVSDTVSVLQGNPNQYRVPVETGSALSDGNGHGTHVASTACSVPFGTGACSEANGGCGVVNSCQLCSIKTCESSGTCWTTSFLGGLDYAVTKCLAKRTAMSNPDLGCVINLSAEFTAGDYEVDLKNEAVRDAVAYGIVFVTAAGNGSTDACTRSPGIEPMAITVGNTASSDTKAGSSNYGSCVDVFAPGSGIVAAWKSTSSTSATASKYGTSQTTPHVAGLAAALLQSNGYTKLQVAAGAVSDEIKSTATMINFDGHRTPGVGIATIGSLKDPVALDCSSTALTLPPTPAPTPSPTPSPTVCTCDCASLQGGGACNGCCGGGHCDWGGGSSGCSALPTPPPTPPPTSLGTSSPSVPPTSAPSRSPSSKPTGAPSASPTTKQPTGSPTQQPSTSPTVPRPTVSPSSSPSKAPSASPTTAPPTSPPSPSPTNPPTAPAPTKAPSAGPTASPSKAPSVRPTDNPTRSPSTSPTPAGTTTSTAGNCIPGDGSHNASCCVDSDCVSGVCFLKNNGDLVCTKPPNNFK